MTAFIFFILLAVYVPVWLTDYFFHDDLLFFLKTGGQWSGFALSNLVMAQGRFLDAPLRSVLGCFIRHSTDLMWLRFAGIFFLSIFGALLGRLLTGFLHNRFQAMLAVVILLTFPAFSTVVARASAILIPLALIMATMAVRMIVEQRRVWAAALFLGALCLYQSAAMVFWPVSFLYLLLSMKEDKAAAKVLGKDIFIIAVGVQLVYALVLWVSGRFFDPVLRGGIYNPFAWSNSPFAKLLWFVQEPLANVFHGWDIYPARDVWVRLLIWFVCAVTAVLWTANCAGRKALAVAGGMFFLLLLSFTPSLIVSAKVPFYRCLLPLTLTVFCPLLIFMRQAADRLAGKRSASVVTAVLVLLVVYGGLRAQGTVTECRILPSVKEGAYVKGVLEAMDTGRYEVLQIIRREESNRQGTLYDEWGALTLDFAHNGFPYILLAAQDGWCRGIFPYISSQMGDGPVDYYVVQGVSRTLPDGHRSFAETGSRQYMHFFLPELNTPAMTYYSHEGFMYFLFHNGPAVTGEKIQLNLNDLKR